MSKRTIVGGRASTCELSLYLRNRGLTSQHLATMTGDSKRTIDSWRSGRRKPNRRSLASLAAALGLSIKRMQGLLAKRT